ncbi:MAG: hypothetical protein DHS20C09_14470 [marine bacterium B5-7]|nr:MAG: hypothetical protein DHS20C09_14470 [marine bacterium B5-7]
MHMTRKVQNALKPVSNEHNHSLLLCWKIDTGFRKNIEPERIKRYADWFFINRIQPHFDMEEKFIYPILGLKHQLIKQAVAQHKRLSRLFQAFDNIEKSLRQIMEELEHHIRFEERVLFKEIQNIATQEQLDRIVINHNYDYFQENTRDIFWS